MKMRLLPLMLVLILITGCRMAPAEAAVGTGYTQIDQETAREMMARDDGHVVVDVRRQDEYDAGHIPGAILIPNESITDSRPEALPDADQIILVYCRSGNRSKQAAEKLAAMGYVNVYEFGGINTWTGEIVTGEAAQAVTVTIESNPTTGYSWEAAQDEALFDIRDEYIAEAQDEPVTGSGGVQKFTLVPVKPGTVKVTFTYLRAWEPSDIDPQFTSVFEIDEDLRVTVVEDGTAQVSGSGYFPEISVD